MFFPELSTFAHIDQVENLKRQKEEKKSIEAHKKYGERVQNQLPSEKFE